MAFHQISQLSHVQLLTPNVDESARFFVDVFGLEETERAGESVYLRAWGEFHHHSLVLSPAKLPALGHIGWRADGPDGLEQAVANLEQAGVGEGWVDGSVGRGPAFRYRGPGGHLHEIFWEIERSTAPAGREPRVPNQPQRAPRRIAPRQLDHVTVTTNDPFGDSEWYRDHLGYRFMEFIKDDDGNVFFSTVTTNEKNHDLGLVLDRSGIGGRLHHVAYWVEEPNDLQRCAALLLDAGVPLEWGPGKHGIGEQYFLYFREPGGIRMEFNSGGYRNYIADWEPVQWRVDEGPDDFYGTNTRAPDSRDAFPPAGPEHAAAVAVEGVR